MKPLAPVMKILRFARSGPEYWPAPPLELGDRVGSAIHAMMQSPVNSSTVPRSLGRRLMRG